MRRGLWLVLGVGAAGGLVGAAIFGRQYVKSLSFALPFHVRELAQLFETAAKKWGVSALDLAGLASRESAYGDTLRPAGFGGTGDFTARTAKRWGTAKGVTVVETLPDGWLPPKDSAGSVRPGPYVIPSDGLGWGRSIMQLDYVADYDWLLTHDWKNPVVAIERAAEKYAGLLKQFGGNRYPAIAAYNAGVANVRKAVAAGLVPDAFTTGKNYATDVIRRVTELAGKLA